ncbi:MAG TPA: STAS domain-containing protein [Pyrinomonadaceae bacterium]|jgi:anti-sigma B factor antagonist
MSKLTIRERQINNTTVLDLDGKLRLGEGSQEFHNTIRAAVEKGRKNIVVNLENVTSIDSSGLGELVAGYVAVTRSGGQINLLHLSKRVHELMFMTKLLTVFDVYDSESEAVNSFEAQTANSQNR